MPKKKEPSWDQIGKTIGKKMNKEIQKDNTWKCWTHRSNGGGFGRFIFVIGILYALNLLGYLEGIPLWLLVIIVIGFTSMRF